MRSDGAWFWRSVGVDSFEHPSVHIADQFGAQTEVAIFHHHAVESFERFEDVADFAFLIGAGLGCSELPGVDALYLLDGQRVALDGHCGLGASDECMLVQRFGDCRGKGCSREFGTPCVGLADLHPRAGTETVRDAGIEVDPRMRIDVLAGLVVAGYHGSARYRVLIGAV